MGGQPDPAQYDRRSIYLIDKRNLRLPFMEVFDAPDTLLSCARRESSTHAPQALELLNGDFSNEHGAVVRRAPRAAKPARTATGRSSARFGWRSAATPDRRSAKRRCDILKDGPLQEFALAVFILNAFLYVN